MTTPIQRIGNYKLERRIGKGGMSEVWLARHRLLDDRMVAIKLLLSQDSEWIERFTLEARITSRLRHEHIIQIYDHGEQPPYHYTVMEHVAGGALREALKQGRRLPLELTLHVFRCAGLALDYAHQHGIIHRDVSPGNILLEPETRRVLLTDFGIARESGKAGLTTINRLMGTPGYLSPEHASSATTVTHLSDIFGLGVVLFEMLTGRLPWDHNPGIPDASGGRFVPPKSLRECGVAGLPVDVDRVIQTMLALEPSKRYPSVLAAIEDLDRVMKRHTSTTVVAPAGEAPPKGRAGKSAAPARLAAPESVVRSDSEPHIVETILGPDMLKAPIQAARRRAETLGDGRAVAALLDEWSARSFFRRRLLGRQAALHQLVHSNVYFYTLRVLHETREPAKTVEEPDTKGAHLPVERELDRWSVALPAPKGFADEQGGTVRLPGSTRVVACGDCGGMGRTLCAHCGGKRVVRADSAGGAQVSSRRSGTQGRDVPAASPIRPSGAGGAASVAAPAAGAPPMVPCPECSGTGAHRCGRCVGVGRLVEHKTVTWRRAAVTLESHDDLPIDAKQRTWLLERCKPVEVYREQQSDESRPAWLQVAPIGDLIEQAKTRADGNTRVVLSEVSIGLIPITEVVFDLGETERRRKKAPGNGPEPAPVAHTFSWHIYGFENQLPNDWRFLNWARVWAVLFAALATVLLVLLVVAIVWR